MLINEVESKVGLSKKTIRYYEASDLFTPKRSSVNDYRNYTEEDVALLKKIKFLRELDVSIQEIKCLSRKEISLRDCMQDRIEKLSEYEKNYQKIKQMCKEIYQDNIDYDSLDIDKYSKEMNVLKMHGFMFRSIEKDHSKKIMGAVISSLIFIFIFLFFACLITYFQFTEEEKMPIIIYLFFICILVIPMISIVINLFWRIKEIKGGEEDEACKY